MLDTNSIIINSVYMNMKCGLFSPLLRMSLVTLFLLSGCVQTRTATEIPSSEAGMVSYAEVNQALSGASATILTEEGERFRAKRVEVRSDSVSWTEAETGVNRRIATCEVAEISRVDRFRGAWVSAISGTLAVGTGILVAAIRGNQFDDNFLGPLATAGILVGVAAVMGGIPGGVLGYVIGGETRFVVCPSDQQR